ncbi:Chalcone domain-containing protein [Cephalotus follicularis]|uniref:Chalcone domain-containing protein n=1 Tax=Cephalotus follicularis TaxID=3775 RepID=A0A1Q3BNQ2_CEPFO|nr:Chalcone domain-containing protein [Cephalotus follicularis]
MKNNWCFFMDLEGGSPYMLPMESFVYVPGSQAIQEAFYCISKFAGALLFWFTSTCSSNLSHKISGDLHGSRPGSCTSTQVKHITSGCHNLAGFHFSTGSEGKSASPLGFGKIPSVIRRHLFREAEGLQLHSVFSLAAAFIPPFDDLSSKTFAVPFEDADIQMHRCMDQRPCMAEDQRCSSMSFPSLDWRRHTIEPQTGIEFPRILDFSDEEDSCSLTAEVLVGTGSRTMKIIKIKSLKVYAFGFYVHPDSLCEKLGPKYASIPSSELKKQHNFYEDLLREDINMTVRLVVNCNGMKINTVRDAFEKSLRARLVKTNPATDYQCLRKFGSFFTQDIPLPSGTTINFRRTAGGQLITEIGGNQIGAVHSKDLCRAFFGMYIGDFPVSEQTKEEIGRNVASLIRSC